MHMKKQGGLSLFLLVVTMLLLLTSCATSSNSSEGYTSEPIGTAPALLPIDITTVITREQVSAALDVDVGVGTVYEEGTALRFESEDVQTHAEINMMECSREIYDATAKRYEDAVNAPNLGEAAIWSETSKQVLVYAKGYMFSVMADIPDKTTNELLVAAREMAVLVIKSI